MVTRLMIMIAALLIGNGSSLTAQTLFSYGDKTVTKSEFLKAYQKNNAGKPVTVQSYRDYLDLYVRYKLKVLAALDLSLDTLPNQVTDMKNFRTQVIDSYIKDDATLDRLIQEAFIRNQKDIHLAHIFISIPKNAAPTDTLRSFEKVNAALTALRKGNAFADVAVKYSDDPGVKNNKGDIGFITAFTLPYELENLAYETAPGAFSKIYRSKTGYHIFKNISERKDIGRIKIAQILFLFPPGATDSIKRLTQLKADSVYHFISTGGDFGEMAKKFSGDNLSYQNNGEMPEFGAGKYDASFEGVAFALKNNGDISAPILTSFGYHIIKKISWRPTPATNNNQTKDLYRQKVTADSRNEIAKKALLQKVLKDEGLKRTAISETELFAYTDSTLLHKQINTSTIQQTTVLFSISTNKFTVTDWLAYAKNARMARPVPDNKPYKEVYEQFIQQSAFDYYRDHLEVYNKEFASQLQEFRDGNLLFEIMQRRVWEKASSDSIGLETFYSSHKSKYWWQPSADAVLFTCSNEGTATNLQKNIKNSGICNWRKWIDSSGASAQADSGRFEFAQLPMAEQKSFAAKAFTSMITNPNDNTVTFAYVINIYNEKEQRNYADARGLVINDYQSFLEDKWIQELKQKYPVKINEAIFASLPKK